MRNRVLFVGDFNRADFQYAATLIKDDADVFFIEYVNDKAITGDDYKQYGKAIFWKDYRSAFDLLDRVKPTKVVFFFLESYNHIALNVASKLRGITTYHLEHGLRCYKRYNALKAHHSKVLKVKQRSLSGRVKGFISRAAEFKDRLKTRLFFSNTIKEAPNSEKEFLKEYYAVRSRNSILDTFEKIRNEYRMPDKYISFSPLVFRYHQIHEALRGDFPVECIGVPNFDAFYFLRDREWKDGDVLFIDQPFLEQNRYGWTKQNKEQFLRDISGLVGQMGKKLYIKLHPLNRREVFQVIGSEQHVVIMEDSNWFNDLNAISVVLGFHSTLMMPFVAMKGVCCFSLNVHPEIDEAVLPSMLESKAIKTVRRLDELKECFENISSEYEEQLQYKEEFTLQWLYKFDGKSSQRLRNILLDEAA